MNKMVNGCDEIQFNPLVYVMKLIKVWQVVSGVFTRTPKATKTSLV